MNQIELLVKGEDNEFDDIDNPFISNRTKNEIDPSLKKLFPKDYNEPYPFIFRNFNKKNREEKIYDIITYKNVSTITMIKSLGMTVLAEGVETKNQADWLIEQGCDYLQGFYYSKPVEVSEFLTLMKKQKTL